MLGTFLSCDSDKIAPGFSTENDQTLLTVPKHITLVETKLITQIYEAVGTIRPLTESIIESQVSAQVLNVSCTPGTRVKKGQLLITLDARQLNTKLNQANEGLSVARKNQSQKHKATAESKVNLDQARATYDRTKTLFDSGIVPSQKLEIDKSSFLQAKARLEKNQEGEKSARASIRKAEEFVNEAKIALSFTRITSPATGVVVERKIDPGEQAIPGKTLLLIQTSGSLRLEANVREGLINRVIMDKEYKVSIQTIGKTIVSRIEEIVPYADPITRTFLVKASLTKTENVYPGMFGRLLIPLEKQTTLLIPQNSISHVGQLELVQVNKDNRWESVYIKTGKSYGDKIEVLAGLSGNETIGYE